MIGVIDNYIGNFIDNYVIASYILTSISCQLF